jgi:gliding motility-associatede transport system auxiliary component
VANRILNILGWLGTALVIAAVAIRFGLPAQEQYGVYLAWAGLACILAYLAGQWREIGRLFGGRQARYGTLSATSVLIMLGVLVAINYIGQKQNKRWDLTANQQYSLSDQTRNVLKGLDQPLDMLVFAKDTDMQPFRDRLQEYQYLSKQISTQYIDPDKQPEAAQQNQVQQYGTIVLKYSGRTEKVTQNTEQDITSGIIKVTTGAAKKIYFTKGHGEKDTTSSEHDGYSTITAALKGENYSVEPLVLAQAGAVPDDATAVVIAGPQTDFLQPEIDALNTYLDKHGKLLLELDPPVSPKAAPLDHLLGFAHDWGFDVGKDVVVDASGMGRLFGGGPSVPVSANYPSHPITERFDLMTAYPLARSVGPVEGGVNGRTPQSFVETSAQSWAETNLAGLMAGQQVELNEDQGDKRGPISIAAALSMAPMADQKDAKTPADDAPKPETRMVVVGDSDFASNGTLGIQGNKDLFMNVVGWLSQQENLISIRPKEAADRRVTLTATQQSNIMWLSLLVIPGFIFGSGVYTWWRRR